MRGSRCSPTTLCTIAELVSLHQLLTRPGKAENAYHCCHRIVDSSDPLGPIARVVGIAAGDSVAGLDILARVVGIAVGGISAVIVASVVCDSRVILYLLAAVVPSTPRPVSTGSAEPSFCRYLAEYYNLPVPLFKLDCVSKSREDLLQVQSVVDSKLPVVH